MTHAEKSYVRLVLAILIVGFVIFLFAINMDNIIHVAHIVDVVFIHPTFTGYHDCPIDANRRFIVTNGRCVEITP